MDESIKAIVRQRAGDCCEYCRLPQDAYDLTFHIEHVVASQHLQDDSLSNLALACDRCNLHKGTNLSTIDPDTQERVEIFHPREDRWSDHFAVVGPEIVGTTAKGRGTVRLLQMNAERRLMLRDRLIKEGRL